MHFMLLCNALQLNSFTSLQFNANVLYKLDILRITYIYRFTVFYFFPEIRNRSRKYLNRDWVHGNPGQLTRIVAFVYTVKQT